MAKKSKKSAAPAAAGEAKSKKSAAVPAAAVVPAAKSAVAAAVTPVVKLDDKSAIKSDVKSVTRAEPAKTAPAVAAPAIVVPSAATRAAKPTPEMVSARAHQIWIDEGRPAGKSLDHWVRAERELGA